MPFKKMSVQKKVSLRAITGYTPAKLITGKRWYVEFYSFDPETQNLHRKRVSVPPVKPQSLRKRHAADMAAEINAKLAKGWNPFLALTNPNSYVLFRDVCEKYFRYLYKLTEDGIMRRKTYNGYTSFLNVFSAWNDRQDRPVNYIYQLKSEVVSDFLDHIWMDEGKSARTRDNYLGWFRSFASWLLEKKYINEDFTAGMSNESRTWARSAKLLWTRVTRPAKGARRAPAAARAVSSRSNPMRRPVVRREAIS